MDKVRKKALKTGVDENLQRLDYVCPTCGMLIPLGAKRCPGCHAKRPQDAYERALAERSRKAAEAAQRTASTTIADRTTTILPSPKAPCYSSVGTTTNSCYATNAMQQLGVPKYYSVDEYGRVFEMPLSYKPLPVAGPVPIATPSKVVQTDVIPAGRR